MSDPWSRQLEFSHVTAFQDFHNLSSYYVTFLYFPILFSCSLKMLLTDGKMFISVAHQDTHHSSCFYWFAPISYCAVIIVELEIADIIKKSTIDRRFAVIVWESSLKQFNRYLMDLYDLFLDFWFPLGFESFRTIFYSSI